MSETTFVWVEQEKGPLPPVGGVRSTRFVCIWGGHEARVVYLPGTPGHYPFYVFQVDGKTRGGGRTEAGARRKAEEALRELTLSEDETTWRTTMTKHTPGPWAVDGRNYNNLIVGAPGRSLRQVVAEVPLVVGGLADPTPEAEANARLIAAAPKLLAACRDVLEFLDNGTPLRPGSLLHQEIEAAVARAEGTP